MKLIKEVVETVQYLTEEKDGKKTLFIEGPFLVAGRILYYDPKEGKYWDPKTDFYVPHDEYFRMVGLM